MSENAIEIKALGKVYKASGRSPAKTALTDIDLIIPKGSMFALLGPNGAGKSTLINILAGLVMKTSGHVAVWGTDIDTHPRQARAALGIVPQEVNFDPFFTPRELLDLQAGMYGVPKAERWTDDLLKMVGLQDKADAYARNLSGGMRRRLMVAKAMVHRPPILVLDEPTAGVDIELRRSLWDNVRALNRQGTTVVLTTHYLEEAEHLCDTIAIIDHGKIIVCEEKEKILARIDSKEVIFRLDRPVGVLPDSIAQFMPEKEGHRSLKFRYTPKQGTVDAIIAALRGAGYGIADLSTDGSDLEDVFLQLTSRH
jgi:ABC-2 type transport system ATP-binding protein